MYIVTSRGRGDGTIIRVYADQNEANARFQDNTLFGEVLMVRAEKLDAHYEHEVLVLDRRIGRDAEQ